MISLTSTRFGVLEVDDGDVIRFPVGIPGFENKHEWILVGDDENAIMWMQSTDDGGLALPVTTPEAVKADYNAKIPKEFLELLGELAEGDVAMLIVVTIPPGRPWDMTANLKSPIVINRSSRVGVQTIALNEDYEFRYKVLEDDIREKMREQSALSTEVPSEEAR
ncbi:MAG: flagellar assembly protein FliW [Synergistaceae bacterium]|jgi:flagellar assembly factor FliW|nr:flagellar assembly protein FliW [Synergistaceae bacterium]